MIEVLSLKKIIYIGLIICLIISNFFVSTVQAKTLGDLKSELKAFEQNYAEAKEKQKLSEAEQEKVKSNIKSTSQQIGQIGLDIDNLNTEIELLNEKIQETEAEIKEILSFTQIESGESAYLQYAYGAKDFTDFIYRIAVSEQLTVYNKNLIDESVKNIELNNQRTQELNDKKIQLAEKQKALNVELAKIQLEIKEYDDLALSYDEKVRATKAEIKLYEQNGCKDHQDISDCASRILPPDTAFWRPLANGYISSVRGLYGYRISPTSGKWAMHWGLDLSTNGANAGKTKAYAVAAGRVTSVISTYGACGGKRVYILHYVNGNVYTSGYLHLNNVFVKENDLVTKDTVIGTLAGWPDPVYEFSDGCSKGAHLHLEISTGTFANGNYESNRVSATNYINFPPIGTSWKDRVTKF